MGGIFKSAMPDFSELVLKKFGNHGIDVTGSIF